MSDVASDAPETLTDEAILARFRASKSQPTGSQTLGFELLAVRQADREVEVGFTARAELLCNPMGQIQGGFVCAMLDECMSVAGMITWFGRVDAAGDIHGVLANALMIVAGGHAAMAIYHQFVMRDGLLDRMTRPGDM